MAAESLAADDPTGWFERVYAAGPQVNPWDLHDPQRLLLRPAHIESIQSPEDPTDRRWRAEFHRPA